MPPMARLSVNVNKVATLRNSRGGAAPSVVEAVQVCVEAGAPGITVHPRLDERHIRPGDVYDVAEALDQLRAAEKEGVKTAINNAKKKLARAMNT